MDSIVFYFDFLRVMEIQLVYILKLLLLPPSGFLLLALSGVFLFRRGEGILLIGIGILGVLFFSLPWTANIMAEKWESIPVLTRDDIQYFRPQAIVVLGGGIRKSGKEFVEAYVLKCRTLSRLRYVAKIAGDTGLPVLVSGGRVLAKFPVSEAELMAKSLYDDYQLVARWQEDNSRNTAENARYSKEILAKESITRIVLVTQAFHMPRALHQFERVGFDVLPAPTDFMTNEDKLDIFSFIPSAFALQKSFLISHEWLGWYWYQLRY